MLRLFPTISIIMLRNIIWFISCEFNIPKWQNFNDRQWASELKRSSYRWEYSCLSVLRILYIFDIPEKKSNNQTAGSQHWKFLVYKRIALRGWIRAGQNFWARILQNFYFSRSFLIDKKEEIEARYMAERMKRKIHKKGPAPKLLGNERCQICGHPANGFHYNVLRNAL